jgi:type I restriction enzyme, R subunit
VQHIEKSKKAVVYSNFADEIGPETEHELPQVGEADYARFKQKARHFLKAHEGHIVLHKLRNGKPLTTSDLNELEKMLLDAGIGEVGDILRARETSHGFGRFVRSLVGLDHAAVQDVFGDFLSTGTATAPQIEFVNMVVEHLTDQGVMDPSLLYAPFTDIASTGPEQVFDDANVAQLVSVIRRLNDSAAA